MSNLFIISNEKISKNKNYFLSANIDFKTLIDGLESFFNINLIARYSSKKENFKINSNKIFLSSNIFSYLYKVILSLKNIRNSKYLIVSITPYSFLAYLLLCLFTNKIFLYLRSDGFKEYENILGKKWVFLYQIMFSIMLHKSIIISCHKKLSKKKQYYLVKPSELDNIWFKNIKINRPKIKINFLFVGRIRIEKGIFFFVKMFYQFDHRFNLTIVGDTKIKIKKNSNIKFLYFFNNLKDLITQYDLCDIFILPSYTEAHPKVIDEALARLRPVIIFDDIEHVVENRKGVFITKRNIKDFTITVKYINNNYKKIVNDIRKNKLPTKKKFIEDLTKILQLH